ncbi:MAG TPA: ribosome-associated translation inhibitor RaiA [Jiangellaceae bacterium]
MRSHNREVVVNIVVKGRNCEVPDRFEALASEKLTKLERYDQKVIRVDVEVSKEPNPRRADQAHRVELTVRTKGPIIRAEAAADDRFAAFDAALEKLTTRMRRAADRRQQRRAGGRRPVSVAAATAELTGDLNIGGPKPDDFAAATSETGPLEVMGEGPLVVREKTHDAEPMTLDQALYEMELVGHDFYLFVDAETKAPSVVYRRKGYDYGVIHLNV